MVNQSFSIRIADVDSDLSISPENYVRLFDDNTETSGIKLNDLVYVAEETSKKQTARTLVLDVSHSDNGIVSLYDNKYIDEVKTPKKIARLGDIIVSRLRPYLRQIGYIDQDILKSKNAPYFAVSTEYYVLRSKDPSNSIGFLVPFLLSEHVQAILLMSVQGGHHPRFREEVLLELDVPVKCLENFDRLNGDVREYISHYRRFEECRKTSIDELDKMFKQ